MATGKLISWGARSETDEVIVYFPNAIVTFFMVSQIDEYEVLFTCGTGEGGFLTYPEMTALMTRLRTSNGVDWENASYGIYRTETRWVPSQVPNYPAQMREVFDVGYKGSITATETAPNVWEVRVFDVRTTQSIA